MCRHVHAVDPNRHLLAKDSPPERQARQQFISEFTRVLRDWYDSLLAAFETGDLDAARRAALERTVRSLFEEHEEAFESSVTRLYEESAQAGRETAQARFDLDISDEVAARVERELRETARSVAGAVGDRMNEDVAATIHQAFEDDLGAPAIEDALRQEFEDLTGYQAERIARTESTTASNRGVLESITDAGAPGIEWLATGPPYHRTRLSHQQVDGQVIPVGGRFTTGLGNRARFPGDPTLPPGDRINCRCSIAPVWSLQLSDNSIP